MTAQKMMLTGTAIISLALLCVMIFSGPQTGARLRLKREHVYSVNTYEPTFSMNITNGAGTNSLDSK